MSAGDNISPVRGLLKGAVKATLATSMKKDGAPYASLVTIATAMDGRPVLLLSTLADHTRNLAADNRASLLIERTEGHANPQTGPRVSLLGRIEPSDDPAHASRFLARHTGARMYAGFADFRFHVMSVERVHFVGGFARAVWIDGKKILTNSAIARTFAEAEPDVLVHMNADHAEAVALYGRNLLKRRGKHWEMIGADPWGIDLRCGNGVHRLDFEKPLESVEALRAELVRLARAARAVGSD